MTIEEVAARSEIAAQRSRTYWLLARLLSLPDDAVRDSLRGAARTDSGDDDELAMALRALVAALDAADPTAHAVEHTRLFGGLSPTYGPPPPLESAQRGGGVDTTVAVTRAYREAGMADIDPAAPDDHLAVELKFMALLALREHDALLGGDQGGVRAARARQRQFLDAHLLAWLPDYAQLIEGEARMHACAAVVRLVAVAVAQDHAFLAGTDA